MRIQLAVCARKLRQDEPFDRRVGHPRKAGFDVGLRNRPDHDAGPPSATNKFTIPDRLRAGATCMFERLTDARNNLERIP